MSKPENICAVLFDLDGTLLDTAADFHAVLETMCAAEAITPPSQQRLHQTVSSGARALVELAFSLREGEPGFKERHQKLLALYEEQIRQSRATLYPGMQALLQLLEARDIAWGIVTNKPRGFSKTLLDVLSLKHRCQTLICPEDVTHTKPHPEPLLLACSKLSLPPERAIYVGDHPRDIESGRRAGLFTAAAAYGYLPLEPPIESWQADLIIQSPLDIAQWLGADQNIA